MDMDLFASVITYLEQAELFGLFITARYSTMAATTECVFAISVMSVLAATLRIYFLAQTLTMHKTKKPRGGETMWEVIKTVRVHILNGCLVELATFLGHTLSG